MNDDFRRAREWPFIAWPTIGEPDDQHLLHHLDQVADWVERGARGGFASGEAGGRSGGRENPGATGGTGGGAGYPSDPIGSISIQGVK